MYNTKEFETLLYRAQTILQSWGIPSHLKGFAYLAEASVLQCLFSFRRNRMLCSQIASTRSITAKTVANSMAYALSRNRKIICSILNFKLNDLYPSRVISTLALFINNAFLPPPPEGRNYKVFLYAIVRIIFTYLLWRRSACGSPNAARTKPILF